MAMDAEEIERLIRLGIPDAEIRIEDLAGDGDHYAAFVRSAAFNGASRSGSIKWCMLPCKAGMGGELHALKLTTEAK